KADEVHILDKITDDEAIVHFPFKDQFLNTVTTIIIKGFSFDLKVIMTQNALLDICKFERN
ncbi:hypothetical protein U5N54_19615, partial [Bacillus paralicheniformis]|uniref:hypothetical protein n=1 Tax=Bacillus paralicheniformis TaxID=1648923 RepID=UPI00397804C0